MHVSTDHVGMLLCQLCDEAFETEALLSIHNQLHHEKTSSNNYRYVPQNFRGVKPQNFREIVPGMYQKKEGLCQVCATELQRDYARCVPQNFKEIVLGMCHKTSEGLCQVCATKYKRDCAS